MNDGEFINYIYLSFGISLSCLRFSVSYLTVPEIFYGKGFKYFVILSVNFSPKKSLVASTVS